MQSVHLHVGDVLYHEGEPSSCVYFVEDGEVEVRRRVGDDEVTVATLGKGQILGEMGVINRSPRSASIVAVSDVSLARIEGEAFIEAFGGRDGLGFKLLRMVCERLTAANSAMGEAADGDCALRRDVGEIRLLGDSPSLSKLLGNSGVVIKALPFEIGASPVDRVIVDKDRLALPSKQLAARHLSIEHAKEGQIVVRDLETKLGGQVNGQRISIFEKFGRGMVAPLRMGDNEVIAGGVHSPVRFTLRLRPAKVAAA